MEPRSTDDSRQLIKLQRGVLAAVVTMYDQIESKYAEASKRKSEELEKAFQDKVIPIEDEVRRLPARWQPPWCPGLGGIGATMGRAKQASRAAILFPCDPGRPARPGWPATPASAE